MKIRTFEGLAREITALKSKNKQKIVAIDGGGGAGKSTFAEQLQKELLNAEVIHTDDFYKGPWNKRLESTDHEIHPFVDWDRLSEEVLRPLQEDRSIQYHIYDWNTHTCERIAFVPDDATIILEGVYSLQERFIDIYDLKIWIDADEKLRLKKALTRDGEHMRFLWEGDWLPVERNYIRMYDPVSRADIVVQGHAEDLAIGTFEIFDASRAF